MRFIQKITKTSSNGHTYARLSITQCLDELGLSPGDEVLVDVDKKRRTITIKPK